ncbi:MAG: sulfur carrier protein ThiS [Spirochaetales bacterium]|nr:sulfur carrier protein ThiS [Spirochaetales bacterium]
MIQVNISGDKKQIAEGISVSKLLEQEKVEMPEYVSVSINEEFIGKEDFDKTIVKDGDEVEFLYFMGGGR